MKKKFMLVIRDDNQDLPNYGPAQIQALIERYRAWQEPLMKAGKILDGDKLVDGTGRTMRLERGKVVVRDGPFVETKEIVGGFYMLQAESFEECVALCQGHPAFTHNASLEIREIEVIP
jgi:hypothetical protein